MLEFIVLLTLISVLLLLIHYKGKKIIEPITEQFEENWLDACPAGYRTYYLDNGNVACCDGELVGNHCLGESQCVLTGNGTDEMPNCIEYIKKLYAKKSKEVCPSSMTNYFENRSKKIKGCTSDRLNASLSEPISSKSPKCMIYSSEEQNINSPNSCYNQKELDKFPCFGSNCKKSLTDTSPPLVMITFTDQSGMLRNAYSKSSVINFLNKNRPNWRNEGIDVDKNIQIAEVAKKFYIDHTIQQSDLQL
jgi:hypothetical protein